MGRIVRAVVVLCVFVLVVAVSLRPAALLLAKKQLRTIFPHAQVSIAACQFAPFSSIRFQGIRVAHERIFEAAIKEARIDFDGDLLRKLALKEVSLRGVSLILTQAGKSLAKLADEVHIAPGKSPLTIRSLRLSGVHCAIKSKELNYEGDFSLQVDPVRQKIVALSGTVDQIDGFGVFAQDASLVIPAVQASGQNLAISLVKVGKARFTQVKGNVALEATSLSIDPLEASLFGGSLQAVASVHFDKDIRYDVAVQVRGLDLEKLTHQLELEEKMQLGGSLSGKVAFQGSASQLTVLSGDLVSGLEGGLVKIKDAQVLKGAASPSLPSAGTRVLGSLDPLDIVVENLKDYHYNTGLVKLGLEGKNIVLYVHLNSQAQGKRDFTIVLHRAQ